MTEESQEILRELEELLEKYNETRNELFEHLNAHKDMELSEENRAHIQHLLNETREKLIHLGEIAHHHSEQEEENKEHFIKHHMEITHHATLHWFHEHHHLELFFEELEELEELHRHILHLVAEIQKEIAEELEKEEKEHNQHAHPSPHGSHHHDKED